MDPDRTIPGSEAAPADRPARYVMIGGFLGAGKTTAVAQLARHLVATGLRVGLITNDQGSHLVDTAMLASRGFPVQEISGGCFCCRFNSLMEAAEKLSAADRPDVFIAEPVGSCTDLVATVSYPLRRIYGDQYTLAPLSVLVDPIRALRVFGLADGGRFSDKVRYIYLKQLEEADLVVINKIDLLAPGQRAALRAALTEACPKAELFEISAREGSGLPAWFGRLAGSTHGGRPSMSVDYAVYAEGEALLGWLNATVDLAAASAFDGNGFLQAFAGALQEQLSAVTAEIAHLKMTLDSKGGLGDLAVINLVRNDYVPELSQELQDLLEEGQVIVNVRAEVAPENLEQALRAALGSVSDRHPGVRAEVSHLEFFRPGKPTPTHRLAGP